MPLYEEAIRLWRGGNGRPWKPKMVATDASISAGIV